MRAVARNFRDRAKSFSSPCKIPPYSKNRFIKQKKLRKVSLSMETFSVFCRIIAVGIFLKKAERISAKEIRIEGEERRHRHEARH